MSEPLIDIHLRDAGEGAVVMAAPDAIDDLMRNTPVELWGTRGNCQTYRGHLVDPHEPWAWGWKVRRGNGSFVEAA